jgi:hypothetical protein
MSVHSKTGKKWSHDLAFSDVSTVDLESTEVVYYHHPYDSLMEGVPLLNALDEQNWNHIKRFKDVHLVHENDSETFSIDFAEDLKNTLVEYSLGFDDIQIIVMDENHKQFLQSYLAKYGRDCNIVVDNYLLKEVTIPEIHEAEITHKFSSLSRNYRDWRAMLYVKLLDKGVLQEHFKYSFFNIWPYQDPPKVFKAKQIVEDLSNRSVVTSKEAYRWLKQCPHELDANNSVLNKWSNVTYDAILSSDFHIAIETHFDQTYYTNQNTYDKNYAPTSITEKTYKAVACKKPFIAFSTYIDESYDVETDNKKRINMIVDEITRICNLPPQEYADVLASIKEITEYNFRKLVEKQNA